MVIKSIIGATWLLFITCAPAAASVEYDYTGNLYDQFSEPTAYTADMAVTGTIELASPMGVSQTNVTVTPLSFSFFDGINTIDSTNATGSTFEFATDGSGNISEWSVNIDHEVMNADDILFYNIGTANNSDQTVDSGVIICSIITVCPTTSFTVVDVGYVEFNPGTWTATVVPVPAAVWLFGSGLLGVFGMARRKVRT